MTFWLKLPNLMPAKFSRCTISPFVDPVGQLVDRITYLGLSTYLTTPQYWTYGCHTQLDMMAPPTILNL